MPASRADVCSGELSQCLQGPAPGEAKSRPATGSAGAADDYMDILSRQAFVRQASKCKITHVSRMSHVAGRTAPATRAVQAVRGV